MPTKTEGNLQLIKPQNGEYEDGWDEPLNDNADKIDQHISAVEDELSESRGTSSTLKDRLDAGLEPDGTPKPVPEVEKSRTSQATGVHTDLYDRLNSHDQELIAARLQQSGLVDGLALRGKAFSLNKIVSGPVGGGNAANFLTAAGSVFTVNGEATPVVMNCAGYYKEVRFNKNIDLTGQALGTKYIYATHDPAGRSVESAADGSTGGTLLNEFSSSNSQFVTKKVKAGDLLVIASGDNAGTFIVDSITDEQNLIIKGKFVSAIGGQSFSIKDMLTPAISYEDVKNQNGEKCYLGEAAFDGVNITSIRTYAYNCEYESAWVSVNVSSSPVFTQLFNHNLGVLPKSISIYASQSNDEHDASFNAEMLSIADVDSDYNIGFNAGTGDSSVAPTGGPFMVKGVRAQITRNSITIKNLKDYVFYKDFVDAIQTSGYIKVIVRG